MFLLNSVFVDDCFVRVDGTDLFRIENEKPSCLTGNGANKPSTATVVPTSLAVEFCDINVPSLSYVNLTAAPEFDRLVFVITSRVLVVYP